MPDGRATFYVVKLKVDDAPILPQPESEPVSGGYSASVWQEGELLYVLVVNGDSDAYRRFYGQYLAGGRRDIA